MPMITDDFKQILGRFATGVTIVTFKNEDGPHGLTVNAFSSVSLDPPLILICIDKNARGHAILDNTDAFVVNILSEQQNKICYKFAISKLSSEERYAGVSYHLTENGIPVFEDNLCHFECKIAEKYAGGDHTIFLGEVEKGQISEDKKPLLFYSSQIHKL